MPNLDLRMQVVSTRLHPDEVTALERAYPGVSLSQALRNCVRLHVGKRLDRDTGYQDGYAAGWAAAQGRIRGAFKAAWQVFRNRGE